MKKLLILIMSIIILLLSSCAAKNSNSDLEGSVDGLIFDEFETYTIKDIEYQIFLPHDIGLAMYYDFKTNEITSKSAEWTINFIYNVNYIVDEGKETRETWKELYFKILPDKEEFDKKCGFTSSLYEPYTDVVLEFVLNNPSKQTASYVILYSYLPIRLVNKDNGHTQTIGVPVDIDVLLKINDEVKDPFSNSMISWEKFLELFD